MNAWFNANGIYAPLWCKSTYAFLEGASHPEELVEEAHRFGLRSIALTDRDGVYGMVRAHKKAQELGVHLIVGSEITIDDHSTVVLLAQDRAGYANLCQLISKGRLRSPKGLSEVSWTEVAEHSGGLLALWGGARSLIAGNPEPDAAAGLLRDAFGDRAYALLARHRESGDARVERRVRERAKRFGFETLAGMEVLYHTPARRQLQDVLTCIRHGVTLATAGRTLRPNAEHALRPADGFAMLYEDDPSSVTRTERIAERCTFSLGEIRYRYPAERLPDGTSSSEWLRELTYRGAHERYPRGVPHDVVRQLEKELTLVHDLDYDGYFLTMWEIVRYCREHGILCQGRGSAANSTVCYCLGITAVDPVRMGLLFERFLSRERAEPPDIDLDIEHDRREEVIQHVYAKYGRRHAAMVANFIRYRAKSAVREVGKVLGLPEIAIERLARMLSHYEAPSEKTFRDTGFDPDNPIHRHFLRLAGEIEDVPRHLSIHPGGFLLGHEPVDTLVPIENATMPDRTVIQWDKDDIENLGLFKVDLLGLGALNVVHRAFDIVEKHTGEYLTLATLPPQDEPTYQSIREGDTVGVFQIESRAQMAMLPRLKPRNYYDLVIEVSIVRPGPITGGMVHPYLRRRNGEEPVVYPHACLEPVLKKTLGIPLFQEQVMQLAVVAADYTPGEADQLRRDMAAWRKSGRIERHRERLISRMTAKGIAPEFSERVFEQIRGFGEYGFPESHAASFALIAYATAWLKRHHAAAFLAAMLNAQPMGFYSPGTLVEDAKRHGVAVLPVDVQCSDWECTLERISQNSGGRTGRSAPTAWDKPHPTESRAGVVRADLRVRPLGGPAFSARESEGPGDPKSDQDHDQDHDQECAPGCASPTPSPTEPFAVRMGLRYVKGLHESGGQRVAAERTEKPFRSLQDFADRVRLDSGALVRLAEAGAFESFGEARREVLWEALGVDLQHNRLSDLTSTGADGAAFDALDPFETITWDYEFTSHSPRGHPLAPLREELAAQRLPDAATLRGYRHGKRVRYAGLVICRQRPGTAKGVVFMTLEDETGFVNLVIWEKVFQKFERLAKTTSFLGVTGKLQTQDGVTHLIAEQLWVPEIETKPREMKSRDFH